MRFSEYSGVSLRKIPQFHLIFWCGNFVERHIFYIVSGDFTVFYAVFLAEKQHILKWNIGYHCMNNYGKFIDPSAVTFEFFVANLENSVWSYISQFL